jgi:type I restriction enzyme S subunit
LIENNLRRIEILEEMAQVVYREWFVNFRFPGYEDVALVESDSGLIPAGWELRPFAELADFVNGYAFKPAHLGVEGLPIVKIKELKSGVTSDTPRNRGDDIPEKFHIGQGELLFSWSADFVVQLWPYGPALLNQHLFRVIPVPGVSTDFLVHALRQRLPDFRARAQGTTMRHIKRSALTEVQTVLPPGPLRDAFSSLVRPMHELSRNLVMQSANLRATRDLLLPRLVSGEINVSNLDIDTEWLAS